MKLINRKKLNSWTRYPLRLTYLRDAYEPLLYGLQIKRIGELTTINVYIPYIPKSFINIVFYKDLSSNIHLVILSELLSLEVRIEILLALAAARRP